MSCEDLSERIAVIVPRNRIWLWHHKLIALLQESFKVEVYASAKAPRYPLSLRLWIWFENCLFPNVDLVKPSTISAPLFSEANEGNYSYILNLSEAPTTVSNACIVEPRYGGHLDSLSLIATLLARKNPFIGFYLVGDDQPIAASYLAIEDRVVLSRALKLSFARLSVLAQRTAVHLSHCTRAVVLPVPPTAKSAYSLSQALVFFFRFFLDKSFGRLLRRFQFRQHWSVVLLRLDGWKLSAGIPTKNMTVIPDDGRRYYADPFFLKYKGQIWLFVEEYVHEDGKGIISCSSIESGMNFGVPRPALVRPYHLSYPFVFYHENEVYMIPETGQNRTVELYSAASFPTDWVLKKVLLQDISLYEATLFRHQDLWWVFGAVAHEGGSAQDELAIYFSPSLEGPWRPHYLNPVKSDCRSARPAGKVISCDGRLLRPAQDCETDYGSNLVWLEIEELTPRTFREREIARWPGTAIMGAEGLHTFNRENDVGAIDIKRKVWKWPVRSARVT